MSLFLSHPQSLSATILRYLTQTPKTNMSIEACIAHAIHNDLDIIEAKPEICSVPLEELDGTIETYIRDLQNSVSKAVIGLGEPYIKSRDAAGLCVTCLRAGVELPPEMMLRMCQTILNLQKLDARFIADDNNGTSVYYMKMTISMHGRTT